MHNVLRLFEVRVLGPAQVQNEAEDRRRQKRLGAVQSHLQEQGEQLPWLVQVLQRCTQCSVKFIRWLRSF
jgi:hypothetical protein